MSDCPVCGVHCGDGHAVREHVRECHPGEVGR